MTCQQEVSPSAVVPLAAEIDLTNSEQVYGRLDVAFDSGAAVVIADFTATWFCDCSSLRRLLTVQRRAAAQGGQLRLVIPPGQPGTAAGEADRPGRPAAHLLQCARGLSLAAVTSGWPPERFHTRTTWSGTGSPRARSRWCGPAAR